MNIGEFLSISVQLAHRAGLIIKDVYESKNLCKQMKGIDDPMTLADIKAQTLIINGLKKFWYSQLKQQFIRPNLQIIGEESQTYDGDDINLESLNPHLFPSGLFSKSFNNLPVSEYIDITENVVVWVDPLDGTLSYVNDELDAVTTLIGLSIGTNPVIGIIGHPYSGQVNKDGVSSFDPKVYFGYEQQRKVFYARGQEIEKNQTFLPFELPKPKLSEEGGYAICTSKNRLSQKIENQILSLKPNRLQKMGGSGKKTIQVLNGQSDFYVYIGNKVKRWDICPGDALLRCFGGSCFSIAGQRYSYDLEIMKDTSKEEDQYSIDNGLIASLHETDVLNRVFEQTKGFL